MFAPGAVNHGVPSFAAAMYVGPEYCVGSVHAFSTPCGVRRLTLFAESSVNQILPAASVVMPMGLPVAESWNVFCAPSGVMRACDGEREVEATTAGDTMVDDHPVRGDLRNAVQRAACR